MYTSVVRRVGRTDNRGNKDNTHKILAMNASARGTTKDAANCDRQCELQNSVNHQDFERILRFRELLEACLAQRLFRPFCPASPPSAGGLGRYCAPVSLFNAKPLTHERPRLSRSRTRPRSPLRSTEERSATHLLRGCICVEMHISFLL